MRIAGADHVFHDNPVVDTLNFRSGGLGFKSSYPIISLVRQ